MLMKIKWRFFLSLNKQMQFQVPIMLKLVLIEITQKLSIWITLVFQAFYKITVGSYELWFSERVQYRNDT